MTLFSRTHHAPILAPRILVGSGAWGWVARRSRHAPSLPAAHRGSEQSGQDLLQGRVGWQSLIQGNSAPLLRGWTHPGLPAGWTVNDGVLSKGGPVDDLVSTRTYKDFELELEWNIGKESNSGIFYRATHQYDEIYWTGPEYQLLDDAEHRGRQEPDHGGRLRLCHVSRTSGRRASLWPLEQGAHRRARRSCRRTG